MENKLLGNQVLSIKKLLETETKDIMMDIDPLDWTYTVNSKKEFVDCQLVLALGGPNIYANLANSTIKGYWGSDKYVVSFDDVNDLYGYFEEIYNNLENLKGEQKK